MRIFALLTVLGVASAGSEPLHDSIAAVNTPANIVVIVKGNSYLENAVAKILTDSLTSKNYQVVATDIAQVDLTLLVKSYSIVFHAVQNNSISNPVIAGIVVPGSSGSGRTLICSISGKPWHSSETVTDGVAAATKSLNIMQVSRRILKNFDSLAGSIPYKKDSAK